MKLTDDRLDASSLTSTDRALLEEISETIFGDDRPALVGKNNEHRIELPEPVYQFLVRVVQAMQEGQSMVMVPETEPVTTQAAANYLGVSRPFFVKLLEQNEIPYHTVGTHRRVMFKDLLNYEKRRDSSRRQGMKGLFDKIDEAGLYDQVDPENAR